MILWAVYFSPNIKELSQFLPYWLSYWVFFHPELSSYHILCLKSLSIRMASITNMLLLNFTVYIYTIQNYHTHFPLYQTNIVCLVKGFTYYCCLKTISFVRGLFYEKGIIIHLYQDIFTLISDMGKTQQLKNFYTEFS